MDPDALIAAIDLVGRSGGTSFEFGFHPVYDDDMNEVENPPADQVKWWAKAMHKGHMVSVDDHPSPDSAAMALSVRILDGATCRYCNRLIVLGAPDPETNTPVCRWERHGERYQPGCRDKAVPSGRNRQERRANERAAKKQAKKGRRR